MSCPSMHAGREEAPLSCAREEGDEASLRGCLLLLIFPPYQEYVDGTGLLYHSGMTGSGVVFGTSSILVLMV